MFPCALRRCRTKMGHGACTAAPRKAVRTRPMLLARARPVSTRTAYLTTLLQPNAQQPNTHTQIQTTLPRHCRPRVYCRERRQLWSSPSSDFGSGPSRRWKRGRVNASPRNATPTSAPNTAASLARQRPQLWSSNPSRSSTCHGRQGFVGLLVCTAWRQRGGSVHSGAAEWWQCD